MGLDMFLYAEKSVSGYAFADEPEKGEYHAIIRAAGLESLADPETPTATVRVVCAYWRKANHIHLWFVDNVQDGQDDCRTYPVGIGQLNELLDTCRRVLAGSELVEGQVSVGQKFTAEGGLEEMTQEGKVIKDTSVAEELLPTTGGFFFGSTAYDEWYYGDVESTISQLERVLKAAGELDIWCFNYRSSW